MVNCYACKKEIVPPSSAHYKGGRAFCGHCWEHARVDAAERGLELK